MRFSIRYFSAAFRIAGSLWALSLGLFLGAAALAQSPAAPTQEEWNLQQTAEQSIEGRRVVRFEHMCLKPWGYTEPSRQYFYVVEPKKSGNGPLLVCLHSAGGNPDKFENGRLEMPQNVTNVAAAGDDFTGLVVNSGIGAEWWWGSHEIDANQDKYPNKLTPVENRILATVEWAVQRYKIDRNRIYLRGISMGGSGTLGIGMAHGDIFAALLAGVPAGTNHAIYRLSHTASVPNQAGRVNDVPPVCVFFSQKDGWAKGMEAWLDLVHREKLQVVAAWGPWGHLNHYEMTDPAAYRFPWLSIRRDQAYPAFTNSSTDQKYPGLHSDAPDQNGQINAYFRWTVLDDQPNRFAIELRLVRKQELTGDAQIPAEVIADVTPRRLQQFRIQPSQTLRWTLDQAGQSIGSGTVTADGRALVTIPRVKVAAKPVVLHLLAP